MSDRPSVRNPCISTFVLKKVKIFLTFRFYDCSYIKQKKENTSSVTRLLKLRGRQSWTKVVVTINQSPIQCNYLKLYFSIDLEGRGCYNIIVQDVVYKGRQ